MPQLELIPALLLGLAVTQIAILVTTVYLHRGLAHRAISVKSPTALVFRIVIWITTGMRPREWAAVHRSHHANTDTTADPHSPLLVGFWRVQLANAALYRRVARDDVTVRRYAKDLPADRLDRVLFDHAALGLGVGITLMITFCVLMGWGALTGVVAAAVHMTTYLMLSGAINAVGHTVGRRPHHNSGTNLRTLALVTGGEGLHNHHHAAPTSARFGLDGELDPGWWAIAALRAVGQVSVRHDEIKIKRAA